MQKSFCGAYDLSGLIARIQAVKDINALRLNIPRYVDTFAEEEEIDVVAVQREIDQLEGELVEVRGKMKKYLEALGVK